MLTTIFMYINIALLFYLLYRALNKMVKKMFADRSERIADEIDTAEKQKADAVAMKTEYQESVDNVAKEKDQILAEARKLAEDKRVEILAEADEEATAMEQRAEREVKMEQERAQNEMKQTVIDVSALMATKFLVKSIDDATHERFFNETMEELEGLAWHN